LFHDSFYVVGHFHVMLAGAGMYGSWGAFYFYFPSIWGVKFSRIWGYIHFLYYVLGQFLIVVPMMWLGYAGMPRRVLDYPASMGGWHSITSAGTLLSVAGIMAFFIMLFDSLRQGRAVTRNTFGIPRYNTRLNFYLYVISRTSFLETKTWYLKREGVSKVSSLTNSKALTTPEQFELTLFSYTFINK
jgi:heme/copper-type cytochrome/quinol oxidase subunit 1